MLNGTTAIIYFYIKYFSKFTVKILIPNDFHKRSKANDNLILIVSVIYKINWSEKIDIF